MLSGDLDLWKNPPTDLCCQSVVTNLPTRNSNPEISEGMLGDPWYIFLSALVCWNI